MSNKELGIENWELEIKVAAMNYGLVAHSSQLIKSDIQHYKSFYV
jgi:hypothetical protein